MTKVYDNIKLKLYHKLCCMILNEVIIETKILNCNNKHTKSHDKVKTTWNIIRVETGKQGKNLLNPE